VGLLCAFGWQIRAQYWGTLLSISIGLVLGSVAKIHRWEPENICRRFNMESHPCRKTRAPKSHADVPAPSVRASAPISQPAVVPRLSIVVLDNATRLSGMKWLWSAKRA
jgi:hypothetical protein